MNKQDQIKKAKAVVERRESARDEFCNSSSCENCPASWENSEDHLSCFISNRYKIEWLKNWIKENDTIETANANDVVISRELLDECIDAVYNLDLRYGDRDYREIHEKLLKLRGEK